MAKILLFFAVGLLFSHQFVAHHHHPDDSDVVAQHNHDHDDNDHDKQLPDHYVAHAFIFNVTSADSSKVSVPVLDIDWVLADYALPNNIAVIKIEFLDTGPPLLSAGSTTRYALRGPPSLFV